MLTRTHKKIDGKCICCIGIVAVSSAYVYLVSAVAWKFELLSTSFKLMCVTRCKSEYRVVSSSTSIILLDSEIDCFLVI